MKLHVTVAETRQVIQVVRAEVIIAGKRIVLWTK